MSISSSLEEKYRHSEEERKPEPGLHIANRVVPWHLLALAGVLVLAAVLNFYRLGQDGYPNPYYAAAIKSMLANFHNFFFVSFDPGGFVSVDKPPLGFWIQTASAFMLGLSPFSVLLPQAIAGVLSVAVLYVLVRRIFGPWAGILAALALALTPISIVTNRNNTIDSLLVLTVLLAAWTTSIAAERGSLRWLVLSGVLVGLGFNIKMLQAYLIVPALVMVYLLAAPKSWQVRILHLVCACLVMLVVSFAWVTAVDLIPASQRPYVGSSGTNSALDLALGYNGASRLLGPGFGRDDGSSSASSNNASNTPSNDASSARSGGGGPGGNGENGSPGLLRFFNQQLGGQVSWLLPLALLGLFFGWQGRPSFLLTRRQQAIVLWGTWLLTMGVFFSIAGFYHTYYLVMIAPAIGALAAICLVSLWQDFRRPGWRGWALPAALVVTGAVQIKFLLDIQTFGAILALIVGCLYLLALAALLFMRLRSMRALKTAHDEQREEEPARRSIPLTGKIALATGLLALLLSPTIWGAASVARGNTGMLPSAGLTSGRGFGGMTPPSGALPGGNLPDNLAEELANGELPAFPGDQSGRGNRGGFSGMGPMGQQHASAKTLRYLEANQGSTKYLLVVGNANTAAPYILDTGKPVMSLHGFMADQIVNVQEIKQLIDNNTVRFFMFPSFSASDNSQAGGAGGLPGMVGDEVTSWVQNHCSTVAPDQWQDSASSSSSSSFSSGMGGQLYDCKNYHS